MENKFDGKVCPYLAQGMMANGGNITLVRPRRGQDPYDDRCNCIGDACQRYPVCVKENEDTMK